MKGKEIVYSFETVKEKEVRKFSKSSIYDGMIDAFIKTKEKLVKVKIPEDANAQYLKSQLDKRLKNREVTTVKASISNSILYLELVK
jgi:riboflavin synthase